MCPPSELSEWPERAKGMLGAGASDRAWNDLTRSASKYGFSALGASQIWEGPASLPPCHPIHSGPGPTPSWWNVVGAENSHCWGQGREGRQGLIALNK